MTPLTAERIQEQLPRSARHLASLERLVDQMGSGPLLPGNRIEPLVGGEQAYEAMLAAIGTAQRSISLVTYIFKPDALGLRFVEALGAAVRRGVAVRVLVDDAGSRTLFRSITRRLDRAGVNACSFHPRARVLPRALLNLRNHRKICVVDGRIGFTGGMNIHADVLDASARVRDVHFRVEGPVVAELQDVFVRDWTYSTAEELDGEAWFPPLEPAGDVPARGIADGPDDGLDVLPTTLLGALSIARRSVKIVTPYFLPEAALVSALNTAALRGVDVQIVLPQQSDWLLMQWAMRATLWQVLERGCRVWLSPPPFDHTKLMVVDDHWTLLGSTNWDPRSLRLNFEFCVECYDEELAGRVGALVEQRRIQATPLTLADVDGRSLPVRLRDGVARLFSPIL